MFVLELVIFLNKIQAEKFRNNLFEKKFEIMDQLTVTERDDYNPHGTRWQCTAKTFILACLDAYMLNLT